MLQTAEDLVERLVDAQLWRLSRGFDQAIAHILW
jgi:hypothetical protein